MSDHFWDIQRTFRNIPLRALVCLQTTVVLLKNMYCTVCPLVIYMSHFLSEHKGTLEMRVKLECFLSKSTNNMHILASGPE